MNSTKNVATADTKKVVAKTKTAPSKNVAKQPSKNTAKPSANTKVKAKPAVKPVASKNAATSNTKKTENVKPVVKIDTKDFKPMKLAMVDPNEISIEKGFNFRKENNYGDIEALALSVAKLGVIEPVHGFIDEKGQHILTDGHRRLKAVKLAIENHNNKVEGFETIHRIKSIPFIPGSSDLDARLMIMITSGEGKVKFNEGEMMEVFSRIIDAFVEKGQDRASAIEEIKKASGVSQATVYNVLKLRELPKTVQTQIKNNEISGTTALQVARKVGFDKPDEIKEVVDNAIESAHKKAKEAGKPSKNVRATSSDVKDVNLQSPLHRIYEFIDFIRIEGKDKTDGGKLFISIMEGLERKESNEKVAKLLK